MAALEKTETEFREGRSPSRYTDYIGFRGLLDHLLQVVSDRGKGSRVRRLLRILSKGTARCILRPFRSDRWMRFRCNICGLPNVASLNSVSAREEPSCISCCSSLRLRTVIHALSTELFGESLMLLDFPESPHLRGLGLSDWEGYAEGLARRLDYTNTFYDKAPQFDITQEVDSTLIGGFDFIVASEVFEHVAPPVSRALVNSRLLLKKDGVLILSVPFQREGETDEHFFDAEEMQLALRKGSSKQGPGGNPLRFHAGPGLTLEMRLFSEVSLTRELHRSGFQNLRFYRYNQPHWGITSEEDISLIIAARASGRIRECDSA